MRRAINLKADTSLSANCSEALVYGHGDSIYGDYSGNYTFTTGADMMNVNADDDGKAAASPTVRVIYIDSPKIVRTDVANFRRTVQQLTGTKRRRSDSNYDDSRRSHTERDAGRTCPWLELSGCCHCDGYCVCCAPLARQRGPTPNSLLNPAEDKTDRTIKEYARRNYSGGRHLQPRHLTRTLLHQSVGNVERFSEHDIVAGLVSDQRPLPDVTMLPPLAKGTKGHCLHVETSHILRTESSWKVHGP